MTIMDFKARKMLVEEALEFASFNRRSLLLRTGALAGASLLGESLVRTADAEEVKPAAGGKKVRIGIPLTYGPFNQPWRRGCSQPIPGPGRRAQTGHRDPPGSRRRKIHHSRRPGTKAHQPNAPHR